MRLLSVDWDYFFPKVERIEDGATADKKNVFFLYDWGHAEKPLYLEVVWPSRAAGFMMNGLPLPMTTGEEKLFWSRFKIKRNATLYIAESHSQIASPRVANAVTEVWNFDAHHDGGYKADARERIAKNRVVHCDDWAVLLHDVGLPVHVRYPRWRSYAVDADGDGEQVPVVPLDRVVDDGQPVDGVFDRVFLCRSGAWVPPWVDEAFFAFVDAAPLKRKRYIGDVKQREWKVYAERDVENFRRLDALREKGLLTSKLVTETEERDAETS